MTTVVDSVNLAKMQQFARLKDSDLRSIAYKQASDSVNDKKHRKINNALWYSIPLAQGVKYATLIKDSRIGRVGNFAAGTAQWLVPFLIFDTVLLAKRGIENHSKVARDFADKHPFLSTIVAFGAGLAACFAGYNGLSKLYSKNEKVIMEKAAPILKNIAKKLDTSKILNKASEMIKKVPSSVKDISKTAVSFVPWAIFLTYFSHAFGHDKVKTAEYGYNYGDLKTQQMIVREVLDRMQDEA